MNCNQGIVPDLLLAAKLIRKEIKMPELTVISTCYKDADKPVVRIGMSQSPGKESKRLVLGPYLTS